LQHSFGAGPLDNSTGGGSFHSISFDDNLVFGRFVVHL
jgi:hypothetical protein